MFITMSLLVEHVSLTTRERNNGNEMRILFGPPQSFTCTNLENQPFDRLGNTYVVVSSYVDIETHKSLESQYVSEEHVANIFRVEDCAKEEISPVHREFLVIEFLQFL
jgi:hypothetical protein